ncbi:hypothetical protein [Primorskyibacter sp. 2E233]|uniref:hypothetical protein n=1 Tax=Primorskyibacter sp. 2E233 TaxID=3413431 RepID=UPI003BF0EC41
MISLVAAFEPGSEIREMGTLVAEASNYGERHSTTASARSNGFFLQKVTAAAYASGLSVASINKSKNAIAYAAEAASYGGNDHAYRDAEFSVAEILTQSLWHEQGWPEGLGPDQIGDTLLDSDPHFDFFRRWYDGVVGGRPTELELAAPHSFDRPRDLGKRGPGEGRG